MSTLPPIIILPSGETAAIGVPRGSASDALLTTALCAILCLAILASRCSLFSGKNDCGTEIVQQADRDAAPAVSLLSARCWAGP